MSKAVYEGHNEAQLEGLVPDVAFFYCSNSGS